MASAAAAKKCPRLSQRCIFCGEGDGHAELKTINLNL